jgi:hypothetical protein
VPSPSFDPEKLYILLDQRRRQERRSFRSTLVRLMDWLGVADIRQFTSEEAS